MDASGKIAGIEALRRGDAAVALAELTRATESAPTDAEAWGYLGVAYGQAGEPAQAVRCLEAATRLAPGSAPLWHNLGNALEQAGRGAEALEAYRRVLAADPGYQRSRDAVARLERMLALAASGAASDPERTIVPTGQEAPAPPPRTESEPHGNEGHGSTPITPSPNGTAPSAPVSADDPVVEAPAASPVSLEPAPPEEPPAGTTNTSRPPATAPVAAASPAQAAPHHTPPRPAPERGRRRVNPRSRGTATLLILLGLAVAAALGWLLVQAGEWLTPKPRPLPPGFVPGLRDPGGLNLPAPGASGSELNAPGSPSGPASGLTSPNGAGVGALRNPNGGLPLNKAEPTYTPPSSGPANVPAATGQGGNR